MAGISVMTRTDAVDSKIALLLSKNVAKIKLDLENDKTTIFGKDIILDNVTCGHYCIPFNDIYHLNI